MVKLIEIPTDQKIRHENVVKMIEDGLESLSVNGVVAGAVIFVRRDGTIHCESISDGYKATLLGALDIASNTILTGRM